jgi:CubicO group peptidase (beta-lactamase class C family)
MAAPGLFSRRELFRHAVAWAATATPAVLTSPATAAEIDPRERAAMTRLAENFRSQFGVPALSIAVAFRGRLLYEDAFGMADGAAGDRATPIHRFRIASVSKPITASAVMDLVELGKLKLDARVFGRGGVLGDDYKRGAYKPYVEDVTVDHLLTHTSGGWPNDGTDPMFHQPAMDRSELIAWALDALPPSSAPGTSYAYSNFGYCVLGRVIERVTGASYADHVGQRILSRCGARDMAIAGNTQAERLPAEVRYYGQGGENPYLMNVRRMDSHGGWVATARDLVAFVTHIDGLTPNILRGDTISRMVTPSAANSGYARGWSVNRLNNWWHTGSLPGTQSILVRTASGFGWAALANTRRRGSPDMGLALDNLIWDMVRQVTDWGALR